MSEQSWVTEPQRQLLSEIISRAIHDCGFAGPIKDTVLCIPEDAADSIIEHLDRVGVRIDVGALGATNND